MISKELKLNLKLSLRTVSEFDSSISNAYLEIWKTIQKDFSEINFEVDDTNFFVKINWQPVLDYIKYYLKYNISTNEYFKLSDKKKEKFDKKIKNLKNKVITKCTISSENNVGHLNHYLEIFLYNFFLIINLSVPGACNIKIELIDANRLPEIIFNGEIFERAWVKSLDVGWPEIKSIPIEKTWDWFSEQKIMFKVIGKTRLEKSLFSLLNIAYQYNNLDLSTLIWLAHSLESLFDTPRGSISSTLRNRILKVLDFQTVSKKKIKKEINKFYNLRSRFVHGDFNISHPVENDLFNKDIITNWINLGDSCDFGLSIVLATLQKMIETNSHKINFKEEIYFE